MVLSVLALVAVAGAPARAQTPSDAPMASAGALPMPAPPRAPALDPLDAPDEEFDGMAGAPPADRKVHGMVEVGAGTGGYREAAAAVDVPVGADGDASIAIQTVQAQPGKTRRRAQ
jgi:hypothetical protein